ncbi:hypothetical protein pqer_cds_316 [Pandoravirus quercus]|uniref:F-box domain containing protein n=1 Tax=Pandoravirus quercus TaxID=2107709 RepID=A0A2U7U8G3_9VIRU|nr:hypothetical protein pqer_cds_316 [Pandoravirus quercus]AVK74738.1 hypothetical protein pqer_cds_316 [Pandoravirus quercus]
MEPVTSVDAISRTTVLAGLPVELWGLIVGHCRESDAPSLSATCTALRVYACDRIRERWTATRDAVDTFIGRWQKATARCDRHCVCTICPYDGSRDDDDSDVDDDSDNVPPSLPAQRQSPSWPERPSDAKWMRYRHEPGAIVAQWLCEACGRRAIDRPLEEDKRWDGYSIAPVDLNRPHVWSMCRADGCGISLVYADHVPDADLVVPAAAVHMLDPHILDRMVRWVADEPRLDTRDICFHEIGSVRGWMPLVGSHKVYTKGASSRIDPKRTRVPMICCDQRSALWGAVVLVDFGRQRFSMTWHGVETDPADLLARWKRHPLRAQTPRLARNWAEWAGEVYINIPEHALNPHYVTKEIAERTRIAIALKEYRATLPRDHPDYRPVVDIAKDHPPRAIPPLQHRILDLDTERINDNQDGHVGDAP